MAAPYSSWDGNAAPSVRVFTGGTDTVRSNWLGLALLRGDSREGGHQLVNILAAAVRAVNFSFVDVGEVVVLGEFLVTVLAVEGVLRHGDSPANIIAPIVGEGWEFAVGLEIAWQSGTPSDDAAGLLTNLDAGPFCR